MPGPNDARGKQPTWLHGVSTTLSLGHVQYHWVAAMRPEVGLAWSLRWQRYEPMFLGLGCGRCLGSRHYSQRPASRRVRSWMALGLRRNGTNVSNLPPASARPSIPPMPPQPGSHTRPLHLAHTRPCIPLASQLAKLRRCHHCRGLTMHTDPHWSTGTIAGHAKHTFIMYSAYAYNMHINVHVSDYG